MEIVTKIAPIALALMMLGLGTSLTINDFTRVLKTQRFSCWFNLPINFTTGNSICFN